MSIIYKVFRTPLHNYVYDRNTNQIIRISDDDYQALNCKEPDKSVIKKFQKRGFLLEDMLKEIEHPDTKIMDHMLHKKMEYLLLQVTQECNLRCQYCVYGGTYENRTHSSLNMSNELSKRAIRYYVERTSEMNELTLGFYGGEPLLRMDLIVFYRDFWRMLKESGNNDRKCHHNGPCIPGSRRLFVSVTGDFYPCEKVPEEEVTRIGNINDGVDKQTCENMLNIGKITEQECKKCWALRICDQCVAKAVENNSLSQGKKLSCCSESRSIALDKLKVVSMFNEFGINIEEVLE